MKLAEGNVKDLKEAISIIMSSARRTKDMKGRLALAGAAGTIKACIELLSDFEITLDKEVK